MNESPSPFYLVRDFDKTGVSGIGVVAEGCVFSDGTAVVRWRELPADSEGYQRGVRASTVVHSSVDALLAVHGHDGSTYIQWIQALD